MSVDATRWAWSQVLKASEKLVLLALADRAGESNECWPSIDRLVNDTGLERKTVLSVIARLEDKGLLVIYRDVGKGNFYTLIGVDNRHAQPVPKTAPVPKTELPSPKNGTGPVPKTGHESKRNLKGTEKRERDNVCEGFDLFWQAYPRKVSKNQAEKAWAKIAPDECLLRVIVAAVEVSKTLDQWQRDNGQFVPHAATWLNGRRWEDELPASVTPTGGASSGLPGQSGRTVSQLSGDFISQGGRYEKNRRFGGTTRREHSAAMGAVLEGIIEREFGS